MSWSQTQQAENMHDQVTLLVGSAIRLLGGECGVFVVSNEAFDLQSGSEYTLYQMDEAALPPLLAHARKGLQPTLRNVLVVKHISAEEAIEIGIDAELAAQHTIERCSLLLFDLAGLLGELHYLRPANGQTSTECHKDVASRESGDTLLLLIAQVAAGLRSALKAQSLLSEQGRLAAIFHYSAEGILTVDNALRIIDFNPAMERLTGWRESEVLGRFYFEVLRPKDRQGNDLGLQDSPILQVFAGQTVVDREMVITARDGQRFDVLVTASCVRSARGDLANGILNIRDVTRERQQEEQRSTFISVISHELQTPIAIIKGYASTLAREDANFEPAVVRSRLIAVEEEADRLNRLVSNLLYASRIQTGGLQMDIATLDLGSLIEGVVRHLEASRPDVSIALDIPTNLPPVMADRDRIEEVLLNLLDNAVKYSPRQREITIICSATSEEVITSVKDSGMGISLRDQGQIFDRFQRIGDPLSPSTPGAGLGLYICRAIVEAHGGHIWVESKLHEGSTFSFSLPREEKAQLPMVVF